MADRIPGARQQDVASNAADAGPGDVRARSRRARGARKAGEAGALQTRPERTTRAARRNKPNALGLGLTDQAGKRDLSPAAEFCPHDTGLPGSRLGFVPKIVQKERRRCGESPACETVNGPGAGRPSPSVRARTTTRARRRALGARIEGERRAGAVAEQALAADAVGR